MNIIHFTITIPVVWLIFLILFASIGLGFLGYYAWIVIQFFRFLWKGGIRPPGESLPHEEILSQTDQKAAEILRIKVRSVWSSFKPVQWLELQIIRDDCYQLVRELAKVYFPKSKQPELEVTLLELLNFNERVAHQVRTALNEIPTFRKISVATLLDAKSLFETTKKKIDTKGIQTGRKIATRIWQAINFINPNYWIQRVLFRGVSEVVGRKVLTSTYKIVGLEAIKLYRASVGKEHHESFNEMVEPVLEERVDDLAEEPQPSSHDKKNAQEKNETMNDEMEWIFPDGEEEKKNQEEPSGEDNKTNRKRNLSDVIKNTLSAFVEGSLHVWDKLVNADRVIHSFQKRGDSVDCLSDIPLLPVERPDDVANSYIRKGRWLTAAEGAATGFGGIFLLSADAVSLLALQLRTIQQIGYCYGFDVSRPEEKLFAAKLLVEAYNHPASQERDALKKEMRMAANLLKGQTPLGLLQKRLFVQGFAKIAEKVGLRFGSEKVAQFIPVIGSAVGSIVNQKVTKDIALTAKEIYRDRFLQQKQQDR